MSKQRARKATGCQYCRFYHDIRQSCEVCGERPKADVPVTVITPKTVIVPVKPVAKSKPRIDGILRTLRQAGMATDNQIAEGLRTGAVMQVISWQLQYEYVIDYLVDKGFSVESYRYRIVCGSAASEYGQQAA